MTKENIIQALILITTAGSVLFVNIPATAFLAPWFGLAAQPFWFYESWKNKQWGIFGCAIVITASWVLGIFI